MEVQVFRRNLMECWSSRFIENIIVWSASYAPEIWKFLIEGRMSSWSV
jgi:hypothetical protein